MASKSIAVCQVCFGCYDSEAKRPRILPCGHTFCSQCLLNIKERNDGLIACPLCKRETKVTDITQLTTNFSILDLTSQDDQQEGAQLLSKTSAQAEQGPPLSAGFCGDHGQHRLFKCKSCDEWICHVCTVVEHPTSTCNVISVKKALEETRNDINVQAEQFIMEYNQTFDQLGAFGKELQMLEEEYKKTSWELEHAMQQYKEAEQSVAGELIKLKKAQDKGLAKLQDLKELQNRVSKLSGVQDIEDCSQAISQYKESVQTWTQDTMDITSGKSLPFESQMQSLTKSLSWLRRCKNRNENLKSKISVKESSVLNEGEQVQTLRSILNQVPPENLEEILGTVSQMLTDTPEMLLILTTVVYESAIKNQDSSNIYAEICQGLCKISGDGLGKQFRNLLINKCQKEFEKDIPELKATRQREIHEKTDPERKQALSLQLEFDLEFRKRSKGNIKLIGELYIRRMLNSPTILRIINTLLESRDEVSLECLRTLLTVVGNLLETKCNQQPKAMQELNRCFAQMEKINDHERSKRLRDLIEDVINLRQNKWVPQGEINKAG